MKLTLVSVVFRGKRYSAFIMLDKPELSEDVLFKLLNVPILRGQTYSIG